MNWRKLFPVIFLFTMVDGFIAYYLYPARLPFLYRDFLILGVYLLFALQEPVSLWTSQLRESLGRGAWSCVLFFLFLGALQIFNPFSSNVLVGVLGFKILFLNWPLAILAFAYVDSLQTARRLLKTIVYFSVPVSLFGLYQFWQGPEFMSSTFGAGFDRTITMAQIDGVHYADSFLRVIGTFSSAGQFSGFILINVMLCCGLLFSKPNKREFFLVTVSLVISFLAMLATGSRGGLMVLVIESVVFVALCKQVRRLLLIGLLLGLSLNYGFRWLGENVIARFESIRDLEMIYGRTMGTMPLQFVDVFKHYPFGRGLGTASNAARHLVGTNNPVLTMVENYPSKLQIETGILGVALFFLLLVILVLRWFKLWLPPLQGGAAFNLSAALIAYCLTLFAVSGLFGGLDSAPVAVFLWALIGMAAKLSVLPSES